MKANEILSLMLPQRKFCLHGVSVLFLSTKNLCSKDLITLKNAFPSSPNPKIPKVFPDNSSVVIE